MFGTVMRYAFFLIGMCALGGLLARPAIAHDSQAQSFTIRAHAQSVCTLSALQNTDAANMTLDSASAGQAVVAIPSLQHPTTAQVQPASISLMLNMVCNRAHSLRIMTGKGGLRPQTASDGSARHGFASRVDYGTHATWGAASANLQTSGVLGEETPEVHSPGAFSGNFMLRLLIDEASAGHLPLQAGTYTDNIIIRLSPHF
jgi:hypothetical protein